MKNGHDTFGKIRKALPNYTDRELKSGICYAKDWHRGTVCLCKRPQHRYLQQRLEQDGRRYSVVKYYGCVGAVVSDGGVTGPLHHGAYGEYDTIAECYFASTQEFLEMMPANQEALCIRVETDNE